METITAKELFEFFQKNLICESLTKLEVQELSHYLQEKDFTDGQIISDFGAVGESLAFVLEGKVQLASADGTEVGKQKQGTLIGEMSFFDGKPRNLRMSACKKGVKLLTLTRPMYDRLKVEQPFIAVNILENAIVSLDNLIRHMGNDINSLEHYVHGVGKR